MRLFLGTSRFSNSEVKQNPMDTIQQPFEPNSLGGPSVAVALKLFS